MKKLTVTFAILFLAFTSFTGFAVDPARPQSAAQLVSQANRYAADGQLELALEHYSHSIRVGMQHNDQYQDAATQQKIVELVKALGNHQLHP